MGNSQRLSGVDFVCTYCDRPAEVAERNSTVVTVKCGACGRQVDGPDAHSMYETLLAQIQEQHGIQFDPGKYIGPLGQMGKGTQIGRVERPSRWTFAMVGYATSCR